MEKEQLVDLLVAVVNRHYGTALAAPSPLGKAEYQELNEPKVGDIVMEKSSIGRRPNRDRIGRLLRIESQPICKPEEWDEKTEGRPVPTEQAWVIQPLLGHRDEITWTNASFIKVVEVLWPGHGV
jgi:hypothetical protein